ncbi:MAG: FAD-dependent oxidoreductase [Proteobacteria bacterium]|nr:FAD-dependent oxidoreductase [Pseudomonadota bacterium]
MKKQLLLIGGGHAHMVTLANIQNIIAKGFNVTVIQPSERHYYSGMGPGMLGGTYQPEEISFATRRQVEAQGGRFILGKAYRIDPHKRLVYLEGTEEEIPFDVLSCNAGSYVPRKIVKGDYPNVFTPKPIEELQRAKEKILELAKDRKIRVAVIGSGPSAIEIAGNIHQLCHRHDVTMPVIQLFGSRVFMSGRPARIRRLVKTALIKKGIEILEVGHVRLIESDRIFLDNGQEYQADVTFAAVGVKPSQIFARSGLPIGPDGGLQVNEYLQSIRYPFIFGGGDCIYFAKKPLHKVGVYAVRQNPVLYHNLLACLEGRALVKFSPGGSYLLIYNLGDGQGVLGKWSISFAGKLAFTIKDWIDRRFIKTFSLH